MDTRERFQTARRQYRVRMGFYIHLAVFCVVMLILLAVNFLNPAVWWVQWPFIGWGIGVLAHGWLALGRRHARVSSWEQRRISKIAKSL